MRVAVTTGLLLLASAGVTYAEHLGSLKYHEDRWTKIENGLVISWSVNSQDAGAEQISIR
jgi:hypothetical protein